MGRCGNKNAVTPKTGLNSLAVLAPMKNPLPNEKKISNYKSRDIYASAFLFEKKFLKSIDMATLAGFMIKICIAIFDFFKMRTYFSR